ncbi:hypothetical protein FQA39_LY11689 [Lamprigera yunnana]|nr:hypothetical protein FQA39_LY11689 [Lamprigera yunnana]
MITIKMERKKKYNDMIFTTAQNGSWEHTADTSGHFYNIRVKAACDQVTGKGIISLVGCLASVDMRNQTKQFDVGRETCVNEATVYVATTLGAGKLEYFLWKTVGKDSCVNCNDGDDDNDHKRGKGNKNFKAPHIPNQNTDDNVAHKPPSFGKILQKKAYDI